jgi:hypothetical protein
MLGIAGMPAIGTRREFRRGRYGTGGRGGAGVRAEPACKLCAARGAAGRVKEDGRGLTHAAMLTWTRRHRW